MERILAATDMTEEGDIALRRAAVLARGLGAGLVLLHVMQGGLPDDLHAMFETSLMARLEGKAGDLRERFGLEVTARIGVGTDWMVVLDRIEEEGADLLVMGTHRHPGLLDLFRGTTVERVAKACGIPLLVVRSDSDAPYRSVLLATDFSLAAREALTAAERLAPEARFYALNAFTIPFGRYLRGTSRHEVLEGERHRARAEARAGMATFLGGDEARVRQSDRLIVEQVPAVAIRQQIALAPTDLLAIGMHSRPRLSEALLGSVARGLMADPPCDILAVPPSIGVENAHMGDI
ncbi:universal stress protein [Limimaricola litoreus]|uniref:Universal stress protein n=1 Tax=Limimaricola litoreus TaxID=2955316 RepID=A0A9X2FUY0_9RHOB|nr:universal stress protein [Limimaricola litoreus]MCP1168936.1 universal stress protein [Limimaricola litoreus]